LPKRNKKLLLLLFLVVLEETSKPKYLRIMQFDLQQRCELCFRVRYQSNLSSNRQRQHT